MKSETLGNCQVSREKYWSELTPDEKIERMRLVVREIGRDVLDINIKMRKINRHKHDEKGMPIGVKGFDIHSFSDIESYKTITDEVYF